LNKIILYTGPVKSGKSTALMSLTQQRKDICGILSPRIDEKKYLYNIQTGESRMLEADAGLSHTEIVSVGKYKFRQDVFNWGKEVLKSAFQSTASYIIIDEIGPLEFEGKGLSPAVDEIINTSSAQSKNLIIVVRESLTTEFFEYFQIDRSEVDYFSEHDF
jgi:nucleoside-triphosphatase THEP1